MNPRATAALKLLHSASASRALAGGRVLRADALSHRANAGHAGAQAGHHAGWGLAVTRGRLVEISAQPGAAPLSIALSLVAEAQAQGERPAWVAGRGTIFYPPDAAQLGVALDDLPVIWAAGASATAPGAQWALTGRNFRPNSPPPRGVLRALKRVVQRATRAASLLLRSGAFGLVVVDLPPGATLPQATLARLNKLAQRHDAATALLTVKPDEAPSLGSMVSLRVGSSTTPPDASGHTRLRLTALKDKRRAPGWVHEEVRRAPHGMR